MQKIAIVLLGNGHIGGAEKRFANLFAFLRDNDKTREYYLIASSERYHALKAQGTLQNQQNILIVPNRKSSNREAQSWQLGHTGNGLLRSRVTKMIPKPLRVMKWWLENWCVLARNTYHLNRYRRKYSIDIMHTVWEGSFAAGFLQLINKEFKHIVTYMDATFSNLKRGWFVIPASYVLCLRTADAVDFLGKSYYAGLVARGFSLDNERVFMSPCSFTNYNKCSATAKDDIVVFAGRLIEFKNPLLFLQIARSIIARRQDIRFRICGEGPLENQLNEFVNANGLQDKVAVEYDTNIVELFAKSKIFVSLQQEENYPSQSILEAMACENVVIATDVGETHKIVPDGCGFRVELDPNLIIEKILFLIDNNSVCRQLGKKARRFVMEKHTIDKFQTYCEKIYSSLN